MEDKERLLSAEEVAELLGIKLNTARGYFRTGRIKAIKVGKLWRVRESDLKKQIESYSI